MSEKSDSEVAQSTTEESSENMKTLLYAKTRAALTAKDLENIRDALEDEGYSLTPSEDGSKIMVQRPKEEDKSDVVAEVL